MTEKISFNPIYIIGNTPLADFLGAKLSLAGEDVYRLGTHNPDTTQTYTIKESKTGQRYSACLPSGNLMHHPAKMTIFCFDTNFLKADLAYFSSTKNNAAPIISFCYEDTELLTKLIRDPIIPAYFNGYLSVEKKDTLIFTDSPNGIAVSLSEHHPFFHDIRQILAKTDIELHFSENNQQNFWLHFIPETVCSLFLLQPQSRLKDLPKKAEFRQLLNTLIDEINSIVPEENRYNKNELISYIYTLPHDYIPHLIKDLKSGNKRVLSFVLSTLQKQPAFNSVNAPIIFKTLRFQSRKALSLVEE
ncbi:MAG: hypothetical protein IJ660_06575 [Alphaproteobacteria bacterium]|nr:hypothetical protein [Alphaproteobacteria bacterium]